MTLVLVRFSLCDLITQNRTMTDFFRYWFVIYGFTVVFQLKQQLIQTFQLNEKNSITNEFEAR